MNEAVLNRICNLALFMVQHGDVEPEAMRRIHQSVKRCKSCGCDEFDNELLNLSRAITTFIDEKDGDDLIAIFALAKKANLDAPLQRCFEVGFDLCTPPPSDAERRSTLEEIAHSLSTWLCHEHPPAAVSVALKNSDLEYRQLFTTIAFVENEIACGHFDELQSLLCFCRGEAPIEESCNEDVARVLRIFEREKAAILALTQRGLRSEASQKFLSALRHPLHNLKKRYATDERCALPEIAHFYCEQICDIEI